MEWGVKVTSLRSNEAPALNLSGTAKIDDDLTTNDRVSPGIIKYLAHKTKSGNSPIDKRVKIHTFL